MDLNRIDRLASANADFNERLGRPDAKPFSDDVNDAVNSASQTNFDNSVRPSNIILSERFEVAKNKRSQGINQVTNSMKLYDRKRGSYLSVAMIANVIVADPKTFDRQMSVEDLSKVQILFDEFLSSIHEKL